MRHFKYLLLPLYPLVVVLDVIFSPMPVGVTRSCSDVWQAWKEM